VGSDRESRAVEIVREVNSVPPICEIATDGITSGSDGNSALRRDLVLELIAGFLTGVLAIPVVINLGITAGSLTSRFCFFAQVA
jgi:hypothetical protein